MAAPFGRKKSSLSSKNEPRKPIPGPTNVKSFVQMIFLHFCKKYLLLDPHYRVGGYLIALTAGGVLFDVFHAPTSYFSDKNNFLNQYFVKLAWGWTLLTAGVATVIWYTWIRIVFHHVEHTTGVCTSADHGTKRECVTAGFEWLGYDISGHTFILIYSMLVITEEAQVFRHWERIADAVLNEEETLKKLNIDQFSKLKELFLQSNSNVKITFVVLTLISLIWELMLIMTIVYFHTVPQKFFGGIVAIGSWFVTYECWYKWPEYSPGLPGAEMSMFLKKRR